MKKINRKTWLVSFLILCAFLFSPLLNCHIDHGLEPINSGISGRVFFKGEIPRHTDEVRVAVAKDFPPRNIKELLFSDMIDFYSDTANYRIYLPKGKYDVVAVIWKEHNEQWNISNIIGVYGGIFLGGRLIPTFKPVTIPSSKSFLDTIDIEANLNRVNRDAKIEGTINFIGPWPENTGVVGVGAFTEIPKQGDILDYYFKSIFIDYTVSTFVEKADYMLRVHSADTVKYIAVLWIDNTFDMNTIQDVGFYIDPDDTTGTAPGIVTVPKDSTLKGIDITVDFSKMGALP